MTDVRAETNRHFADLCRRIRSAFEALDTAKFEEQPWEHEGGGGGLIAVMKGTTFEKVGVNCSAVWGDLDPEFAKQLPGDAKTFYATGISLVAHMVSPLAPAVHLNLRYIETNEGGWFGGGTDLTPYYPFEEDTRDFHAAIKAACDRHHPDYYPKFKKWCDEYFFLPHRNEPRGVGGIFFDYLTEGAFEERFAFTRSVGEAFLDIYPKIVDRRRRVPYTPEQREYQLYRRGRYVEFNLLYDRGTQFGLKTKGNVEAIFVSLPPIVKWR
ncbi:MAG: oxygen-dependent coproporphyrinogen oxidase [Nitrospirota bacterium]